MEDSRNNLVGKFSHLDPLPRRIEQIMRELTAIAVGDSDQQITPIVRRTELDLSDAREIPADHVRVHARWCAEFVKVDLLIKVTVLLRALITLRITGVVEAGCIFVPRHITASSWELDTGHYVRKFLAGGNLEHMDRAVLTAVVR